MKNYLLLLSSNSYREMEMKGISNYCSYGKKPCNVTKMNNNIIVLVIGILIIG